MGLRVAQHAAGVGGNTEEKVSCSVPLFAWREHKGCLQAARAMWGTYLGLGVESRCPMQSRVGCLGTGVACGLKTGVAFIVLIWLVLVALLQTDSNPKSTTKDGVGVSGSSG